MKKVASFFALALATTLAAPAAIADGMPGRGGGKAVAYEVAPYHNWGGLYIGASAGWAGTDIDWTYPNGAKPQGIDHSGGTMGIHVGIQHQMGAIVVGVEAAYNGLSAWGGNDYEGGACPNAAFSCQGRLQNFFTVGPRLGWAITDRWMLYATGGYASGHLSTRTQNVATGAVFDVSHSRHDGWFVGGGLEYALSRNWILGIEYQHIDLDTRNIGAVPFLATEVRNGLNGETDVVKARLSFKIGRPEPAYEPLK